MQRHRSTSNVKADDEITSDWKENDVMDFAKAEGYILSARILHVIQCDLRKKN